MKVILHCCAYFSFSCGGGENEEEENNL